jgi:hypothetical protein
MQRQDKIDPSGLTIQLFTPWILFLVLIYDQTNGKLPSLPETAAKKGSR